MALSATPFSPGAISITLDLVREGGGARARRVRIASSRPTGFSAALLVGRAASEVPGVIGRLHSLCGRSHTAASEAALAAAERTAERPMFSRIFIDRPIFAWVLAIIVMLSGIGAILALPIAQYPDVAPPQVTIRANYPGASAETQHAIGTGVFGGMITATVLAVFFVPVFFVVVLSAMDHFRLYRRGKKPAAAEGEQA